MKITASYSVHIRDSHTALHRTAGIFSDAVVYLAEQVLLHWDEIDPIHGIFKKKQYIEHLVHSANSRKAVCDFDRKFLKFPTYYMRAAIAQAYGIVASYMSQLENWEKNGRIGDRPKMDSGVHHMPALYRGNTYKPVIDTETGNVLPYLARIKVYRNNDWVWDTVRLSKTDVDYLARRGAGCDIAAPVLEKKYSCWKLRFAVTEKVELSDKPVHRRKICAVDLGITTDAVCSVIDAHGTVLARRFIKCGREKDQVFNALHRVSVFQKQHGSHDSGRLWNLAKRRNQNLAHQVSRRIINFAARNGCDVVVFEYLDTNGRKYGSRKQKLAMWKHAEIQNTVESLAHHYSMRVSRVNAKETSRLAYDGSGRVKRGREVSKDTPYDICVFSNGKTYNCDLSASYNIGARYFIRELLKELPDLQAEVPEIGGGARRNLADLWKIDMAIGRSFSAVC